MKTSRDFEDLLACFNARGVEYLVVGAHALAFHGKPRFTRDLDVLVRSAPDNARRILSALDAFGFPGTNHLAFRDLPALLAEHRPLGRDDEPYEWLSETTVSPG